MGFFGEGVKPRLMAMQLLGLVALIGLLLTSLQLNHPEDSMLVKGVEGLMATAGPGVTVNFPNWAMGVTVGSGLLLGLVMVKLYQRPGLRLMILVVLLAIALAADVVLWQQAVEGRGVANGIHTQETLQDKANTEWFENSEEGKQLFITSGTARGSHLEIIGNDNNTLYLEGEYRKGELPSSGQSNYVILTADGYKLLDQAITVQLAVLLGMVLVAGMLGLLRMSLKGLGLGAVLALLLPLSLSGTSSDNILYILLYVLTFLIYIELGYAHYRYTLYSRTMAASADFYGVIFWFFGILFTVIIFTTLLTAAAFQFHTLLEWVLPLKYTRSIEFNTIYGQALSVLAFFAIIATIQSVLARKYLARAVDQKKLTKEAELEAAADVVEVEVEAVLDMADAEAVEVVEV